MRLRFARILSFLAICLPLAVSLTARANETPSLDARVGLNAYLAFVDQHLLAIRDGLRLIASTENAASGDWLRIQRLLSQFSRDQPNDAAMWFARPDGSYFTVERGLVVENLKDREYFPRLMAGKGVMGDLVASKSTDKRAAIIAEPIHKDGEVIGAFGTSVDMERLAGAVDAALGLPRQVMFYALDSRGQIALHREANMLFEFAAGLGGADLQAAIKTMLTQPEGVVRYRFEGADRVAVFKRSPTTGFVYALRW